MNSHLLKNLSIILFINLLYFIISDYYTVMEENTDIFTSGIQIFNNDSEEYDNDYDDYDIIVSNFKVSSIDKCNVNDYLTLIINTTYNIIFQEQLSKITNVSSQLLNKYYLSYSIWSRGSFT
jgi:hypothetical protein